MHACWEGRFEIVRILLQSGASVKPPKEFDLSPVHLACRSRSIECLSLLYGYGADLSERDVYNRSPLLIAMATSQWDMVVFMLDSGVDLYESGVFDNSFRCKLMFSSLYAEDDVWPMEISELLLDRGLLNKKNEGTSNFILTIHQGLNMLKLSEYYQ